VSSGTQPDNKRDRARARMGDTRAQVRVDRTNKIEAKRTKREVRRMRKRQGQ
jgi:hypothetical protein